MIYLICKLVYFYYWISPSSLSLRIPYHFYLFVNVIVNNDERTAAVKVHHDVLGTHLMDFVFADWCYVNNNIIINNKTSDGLVWFIVTKLH